MYTTKLRQPSLIENLTKSMSEGILYPSLTYVYLLKVCLFMKMKMLTITQHMHLHASNCDFQVSKHLFAILLLQTNSVKQLTVP